jgi:arsenate reductase
MTERVFDVLFLGTGNSVRSILAESVLAKEGAGRFRAYSAGNNPKGQVHPTALAVLKAYGFPHEGFRSKSWTEFEAPDAPRLEFIFTVCDDAAGESCPDWPGRPVTAHWGIENPAAVEGEGQYEAFLDALRYLRRRIELLVELPMASLGDISISAKLNQIGQEAGATRPASA